MRKGGGHAKGSQFERDVAKKVVKAFSKLGIVQRDCWRSVLSGGHVMSTGDLVMSEKLLAIFPYAVECKFHKKVDWWHFVVKESARSKSWKEWLWVQQAIEGTKDRKELCPLLIIKENHGPTLVAVINKREKLEFETL